MISLLLSVLIYPLSERLFVISSYALYPGVLKGVFVTKSNSPGISRRSTHREAADECVIVDYLCLRFLSDSY